MAKRILSTIIIIIFLLNFNYIIFASKDYYLENTSANYVAKGILQKNIVRFTKNGFLNINVLEVDYKDQSTSLKILTDNRGVSYLNNILELANQNKVDCAINADFFAWRKGEANRGSAIGPIYKEGNLISSSDTQSNMASFIVTNEKNLLLEYFNTNATLTAPNGQTAKIKHINKYDSLDGIVLYTKDFAKSSLGSYNNIVEMVVENDIVKEIRQNMPAIDIPENGYIITFLQDLTKFPLENFKVLDKVTLNIEATPNVSNINMAIGGGTMLLKDGQISPITHNVSGVHPRTALGIDKEGTRLFLVTVDGRQEKSVGMSLPELSDFMLSIGSYNAINFDGGGSTTMVSRTAFDKGLSVINSISGGIKRNVINGIGISSNTPFTELYKLKISAGDGRMFVNTSKKLDVFGTDTNYNPFLIDKNKVKWSVFGVDGEFKNNEFFPKTSGKAIIYASYNNIEEKILIDVLDEPKVLEISPSIINSKYGEEVTITVLAKDKNGYFININPSELNFDSSVIGIKNDKLVPLKTGSFDVNINYKNATSKIYLNVASNFEVSDSFEKQNGSFWGYPAYVQGGYEISSLQKRSGSYSGKLSYNFNSGEKDKKGSYLVFSDNGKIVPNNSKKIGVWAFCDKPLPYWLGCEIKDSENNISRQYFAKGVSNEGWSYYEIELPKEIKNPSRLTKIYLLQTDENNKGEGEIYLDDLTFIQDTQNSNNALNFVPKNNNFPDSLFIENAKNENNQIIVFSEFEQKNNLLNLFLERKMQVLSNQSRANSSVFFNKPFIIENAINTNSYLMKEYKDYTLFTISNINGGIRKANDMQWEYILNDFEKVKTNNVIIAMPKPLYSFEEKLEATLFQKIINEKLTQKGKQVFVLYSGDEKIDVIDNVRYIGLSKIFGSNLKENIQSIKNSKYLLFFIRDNKMYYTFKKLF